MQDQMMTKEALIEFATNDPEVTVHRMNDTHIVISCGENKPRELDFKLVTKNKLNAWEAIKRVISGTREAKALMHMTRVCGYFSRTENWNPSKMGELKDRHKGNYAVAPVSSQEG